MGVLSILGAGIPAGLVAAWLLRERGGLWRTLWAVIAGLVVGLTISVVAAVAQTGSLDLELHALIGAVLGPIAGAGVARRKRAPLRVERPGMRLR